MENYKKKVEEEQKIATKKKAIVPNLSRLLGNLVLLYFIPSELIFFKWFIAVICLYSFSWFVLELVIVLDYQRLKILPFFPATSDLISAFILIYLTGSGNSVFTVTIIAFIVVSMLFSADTQQSTYLIIASVSLYILLLAGLYFEVYPYVNFLNFENHKNILNYIFSLALLVIILVGMFNSIRFIAKANVELNEKLKQLIDISEKEKARSEKLLLNVLPSEVAEELKDNGVMKPVFYESVTIVFTDFVGFTKIAERMSPEELIKTLDASFTKFDKIIEKYKLEKLKTIGDSYMCAGGLPLTNKTHPIDACLASLEIQSLMADIKELQDSLGFEFWDLRIGIHSGPVITGVVGEKKFAYDIWGDAVNTASRLEASGESGEINISKIVYEYVKDFFDCEYRGKVHAKNKGDVDMYFLKRLKSHLSLDHKGIVPNEAFFEIYRKYL